MVKVLIYILMFIFSTPVLIRHLWQLTTVVFLHWCLINAVLLDHQCVLPRIHETRLYLMVPKYKISMLGKHFIMLLLLKHEYDAKTFWNFLKLLKTIFNHFLPNFWVKCLLILPKHDKYDTAIHKVSVGIEMVVNWIVLLLPIWYFAIKKLVDTIRSGLLLKIFL